MTATTTASSASASSIATGLRVRTRSTLTPLLSIGVITMKMISSTSITSTIGVTLISLIAAIPPRVPFFTPSSPSSSSPLCMRSSSTAIRSFPSRRPPIRRATATRYYSRVTALAFAGADQAFLFKK